MTTDEKIAVGVALVVVAMLFVTFLPAFWSDEQVETLEASAAAPSLEILP